MLNNLLALQGFPDRLGLDAQQEDLVLVHVEYTDHLV